MATYHYDCGGRFFVLWKLWWARPKISNPKDTWLVLRQAREWVKPNVIQYHAGFHNLWQTWEKKLNLGSKEKYWKNISFSNFALLFRVEIQSYYKHYFIVFSFPNWPEYPPPPPSFLPYHHMLRNEKYFCAEPESFVWDTSVRMGSLFWGRAEQFHPCQRFLSTFSSHFCKSHLLHLLFAFWYLFVKNLEGTILLSV